MKYLFTLLSVVLLLSISSLSFSQSELEDPTIGGIGNFEIFENLRGISFAKTFGYGFSISPDENWIIIIDTYPNKFINLFHIHSKQKWTYSLHDDENIVGQWFPNCFSEDSSKVFFGKLCAVLDPSMTSLDFQRSKHIPNMKNFEGSFLGFKGFQKNRKGEKVTSWWAQDQNEGEFGEITWSYDEVTLYETSRDDNKTYLISSHPRVKKVVDFSILFEILNDKAASARVQFKKMINKKMPNKTPEEINDFLEKLMPSKAAVVVKLDHLSVSPNNEYIACIATIGQKGFIGLGKQYGIIIPLEDKKLTAYPFSKNVYQKILWAKDSQSIYYYAQPVAGSGNGTIYKLNIAFDKY